MAAFRCARAWPLCAAASHESGGSAYGPVIRSTTWPCDRLFSIGLRIPLTKTPTALPAVDGETA